MEEAGAISVATLRGVGEQRVQALARLGIVTVEDLLLHYPRGYIDLTAPCEVMSAPLDQVCAVRATVIKKGRETRLRGGLRLYKVIAADDSGVLELTFFNTKFTVDALKIDEPYLFYGRMEGTLLRREMRALPFIRSGLISRLSQSIH